MDARIPGYDQSFFNENGFIEFIVTDLALYFLERFSEINCVQEDTWENLNR